MRDLPDTIEDEEELYEDTAKGEDATHEGGGYGMREPVLVWDLPRDLVSVHRLLQRLRREGHCCG